MTTSEWFDDLPVLGSMDPEQAAAKLQEVGEDETAARIARAAEETLAEETATAYSVPKGRVWPFGDRPWQHTAHTFGHLAPAAPGNDVLAINHAGNIPADHTLKNSRIKITLDRLRVADYPGSGTHRVLFDFYAQNQVPDQVEHLHFNATYRVREGEQAAILGYPLFVGLNVGTEGVVFKCFTVNVANDADEAFLTFLESDAFKAGLQLATTMQPAIGLFSETALALTKAIAEHNRNVPVQDFYMGLDFGNIPTRARLAEGSYLAVQIPEDLLSIWDWSDWVYSPNTGQVTHTSDPTQLIPYNYLVFSISRLGE
jgi:hypothetical protein